MMNNGGFLNLNSISIDDLPDEYKKLLESYHQLKKLNDDDKQQIYELQRNLKTAKAAEFHLSQELEIISSVQNSEIDKNQFKYQQELDEFRRTLSETKEYNNSLEQNVEELTNEITKLNEKIEEISINSQKTLNASYSNGNIAKELKLEKENIELLTKIDELQDNIQKSIMIIAEKESQIEVLKEQIQCLEENLSSKRDDLEEKNSLLESTQERIIELNAELALFKSAPENHNRKGNSLFAEVDDQRKKMKQVLALQKKNYLHMKKIYNESEHEIRRLKRENSAMHNELQTCSAIFLNADKTYKEKLYERISQLLKQNDELQTKLRWTEDRLISLGAEKGVDWLDSILTFCKNETKELEAQLYSCRMQKALIDRNYQNSQEEYAKWRFEALKSRCIIIDRESLLDEHSIQYKNFTSNDFHFSEKQLEVASPQISFGKRRSIAEHLENKTVNNRIVLNTPEIKTLVPNTSNLQNVSIICSSKENNINKNSPQNINNNLEQKSDQKENCDNFFEVYEDTSTFTPTKISTNVNTLSTGIKELGHNNIKNSENSNKELMCPIKINYADENKCSKKINKDECTQQTFDENINNNNNLFEIYEDTTKNCISSFKSNNNEENFPKSILEKENKETQAKNVNFFEIYNDPTGNMSIINNEENCKTYIDENEEHISIKNNTIINEIPHHSVNSEPIVEQINTSFEIYEDTTKMQMPLQKLAISSEHSMKNLVKDNDKENSLNSNKPTKNNLIKLQNTIPEINSNDENASLVDNDACIKSNLVEKNDIFAENFKYVKFDEKSIKKEEKTTVKVISKRTKPNVVIRHIHFNKSTGKN